MRIQIRIQGVKNVQIRMQGFIFTKNYSFFVKKAKQELGIQIKMPIRIQIQGLKKCGSGSRDSKNADPMRIPHPATVYYRIILTCLNKVPVRIFFITEITTLNLLT
jgi:hypothetical protein